MNDGGITMKFTSVSEALAIVNNSVQLIQNGVGLSKTRKVCATEAIRYLQTQLRAKGCLDLSDQCISGLIHLFDTYKPDERPEFVRNTIYHFLNTNSALLEKLLHDYGVA